MVECKRCGGQVDGNGICPYCGTQWTTAALPQEPTLPRVSPLSKANPIVEELLGYIAVTPVISPETQQVLVTAAIKIYNGIDTAKDEAGAKKIFESLVLCGNTEAMFWLGQICCRETIPDIANAKRWFAKAAAAGHVRAKNMLEWIGGGAVEAERPKAPIPQDVPDGFVGLVKEALPSTLKIEAYKTERSLSLGSGFIIEGGYVVTNHHVVDGGKKIMAIFADDEGEKEYPLNLLASEKNYDVAILKFEGNMANVIEREGAEGKRKLFPLRSGDVQFGEEVYTVGNPLGIGISVSKGVVSNPNAKRKLNAVDRIIQTDMSVNHGNSGGALLDRKNNVLGIVSAGPAIHVEGVAMRRDSMLPPELATEIAKIASGAMIGASGITFVVPSEYITKVLKTVK